MIAARAVPQLVALLRSAHPKTQGAAANALANLAAGFQQNKRAITAAGAVPLLVALCQTGEPDVQQTAERALLNLDVSPGQSKSCCSMM